MLGGVLRRARLDQRRTLADVARASKVSMPYLSEVERGRKEVSSEVLAAICEALRIDLSDVLAEVGRALAGTSARRDRAARLASVPGRAADPGRAAELELVRDPAAPGGLVPGSGSPPPNGPANARCLVAA
jgi:transcriptional regulator with XRE-family HTH domain